MKRIITGTILATVVMAHAGLVDNFDRADTNGSGTAVSTTIGNGWVGQDVRQWLIESQTLKSGAGAGNYIYNTNAATLNSAADTSFTMSALITLNSTSVAAFGGLAVNYDSAASNGLVFRINGEGAVQLLRPNGTQVSSGTMTETFISDREYRMTISSDTANSYKLEIYDTVLNTFVYTNTVVNGGGSARSDGIGGLYVNTAGIQFDNFSLVVIPEAKTLSLFLISMVGITGRQYLLRR